MEHGSLHLHTDSRCQPTLINLAYFQVLAVTFQLQRVPRVVHAWGAWRIWLKGRSPPVLIVLTTLPTKSPKRADPIVISLKTQQRDANSSIGALKQTLYLAEWSMNRTDSWKDVEGVSAWLRCFLPRLPHRRTTRKLPSGKWQLTICLPVTLTVMDLPVHGYSAPVAIVTSAELHLFPSASPHSRRLLPLEHPYA